MNRKGASYAGFFRCAPPSLSSECLCVHDLTTRPSFCSLPRSVLPEECTLQVLSFLSERDLANVALLNRQFKRLAEDDAIWRLLSMRYHNTHNTHTHYTHTAAHTAAHMRLLSR
jgi:hypothetical protein